MISHSGTDSNHCGHDQSNHCRTIGYVLTHRLADNDIIRIINNNISEPFTFNRSFPLLKNLSLVGVSGWPTILAQTPNTFLFEDSELPNSKLITIQIRNLTFKGSGIIHLTKSFLARNTYFKSCHFENVLTHGDMIRIENQTSPIQFQQCYFVNNTAKGISRLITIVYSHSIFKRCYFFKNKSTANGSIAIVGGYSWVKDSKFKRNTILREFSMGGAIYALSSSVVKILNCSFQMNRVTSYGGAISHSGKKLIVELSSFQNNDVSHKLTKGGAIYVHSSSFSNLSSSSSIENKVDPYSKIIDGKIKILLIRESSFVNNSAFEGGAIFVSLYGVRTNISSCIFQENTAMKDGGAIKNVGKEPHLKHSSFDRNSSGYQGCGGAVYNFPYPSTPEQLFIIETSAFYSNSACHNAGAIFATSIETKVSNSTFRRNRAGCGEYREGGAIAMYGGKKLEIDKSLFQENSASGQGGALFTYNQYGNLYVMLNASFLENNNAGDCGGGVFADSVNIRIAISNCTVKGNTAGKGGGAIFSNSRSNEFICMEIEKSILQENSAVTDRGAIFTSGFHLILKASFLQNNNAGGRGGGIHADSVNTSIAISNCTIKRNTARIHGGAICSYGKELILNKVTLQYNSLSGEVGQGGALYLYNSQRFNTGKCLYRLCCQHHQLYI